MTLVTYEPAGPTRLRGHQKEMPGLTLDHFVTYLLSVQKQLRHTYHSLGNRRHPYHFRFSVSSDVHRDPSAFGRPVGVFNADCYGITRQTDVDEKNPDRPRLRPDAEPNTADRFPIATRFASREEAALECDFWKLVLKRKFFLEIAWSHGSEQAFVEAARANQIEPYQMLEDESTWSVELLDFIEQHSSKLWAHRDVHKPDLDLDEWMRVGKQRKNPPLMLWVENVRALQAELAALPDAGAYERVAAALLKLKPSLLPDVDRRCKLYREAQEISRDLGSAMRDTQAVRMNCEDMVFNLESEKRRLTYALKRLIEARPPLDLPIEQQSEYYQADVS